MKILIDSNIIIGDYPLKKGESILFLRNFKDSGFKCFISQVTYSEILVNFERQLQAKIDSYNSVLNKINRQVKSGISELDETYVSTKTKEYSKILKTKLNLYGIEIYPIVEISHEKILKQLFSRKHPFDNKDNGYKDFLIFGTALELLKDGDLIILSKDNDFGEQTIHPDLSILNETGNNISLRKSFEEINNNELKSTISKYNAKLDFITDLFKEDNHQDSYFDSVIDFLESKNLEIFPDFIYDLIDIIDTPYLDYFSFNKDSAKIKSVKPISERIVIVKFEVVTYLRYLFAIESSNNYQLQNLPSFFQISKTHEGYETFVEVGYWFDIEVTIQANMEGGDIQFWDLKIIN